jgi:hypothetical protein
MSQVANTGAGAGHKVSSTNHHRFRGENRRLGGRRMSEPQILAQLMEWYLGLETLETTEELLLVCGASIDVRALPVLRRRLQEEEARVPLLEARGYIRMRENSEQLIASLKPLIALLEETHDPTKEQQET